MKILVQRALSSDDWTIGGVSVDGKPHCFSLEDEHRDVKVPGETRIPAGEYDLRLRTEGGMHEKYLKRFPDLHVGMLWFQDVPSFTFVYFHCGVTDEDTAGCVLVADTAHAEGRLEKSEVAYRRFYAAVIAALLSGEAVKVAVED